jgi:hypothetical protein
MLTTLLPVLFFTAQVANGAILPHLYDGFTHNQPLPSSSKPCSSGVSLGSKNVYGSTSSVRTEHVRITSYTVMHPTSSAVVPATSQKTVTVTVTEKAGRGSPFSSQVYSALTLIPYGSGLPGPSPSSKPVSSVAAFSTALPRYASGSASCTLLSVSASSAAASSTAIVIVPVTPSSKPSVGTMPYGKPSRLPVYGDDGPVYPRDADADAAYGKHFLPGDSSQHFNKRDAEAAHGKHLFPGDGAQHFDKRDCPYPSQCSDEDDVEEITITSRLTLTSTVIVPKETAVCPYPGREC